MSFMVLCNDKTLPILLNKKKLKIMLGNKCWRGLTCWLECKLVQPLWRTVWRFLKKLELELPYDQAIPLLGIHTE